MANKIKRPERLVMDSNRFYSDNDELLGVTSKESFRNHINSLNEAEKEELSTFLQHLTDGVFMRVGPKIRVDRKNRPYYWVIQQTGVVNSDFKLLIFEGLDKLIKTNGQFIVKLSLDDLCEQLKVTED